MIKRIGIYLKEMFPFSAMFGTILTGVAIQLVYLRLYGFEDMLSARMLIPGLIMMFINLLIRVMDEFKDYQDDLTNFPERPLPSGRVKHGDLKTLGIFCVLMVIFLSSTSKSLLIWSIFTLCYTGLMLKWFFIEERMRKSLPLAFFSHHPIVFLNFIFLILACQEIEPSVGWDKAYLILPLCFIFTNWEIMRKVRMPKDETQYTTYSKILGTRRAIFICLILQLIFIGSALAILLNLAMPVLLIGLYCVVQLFLLYPTINFFVGLTANKPLKVTAERQILSIIVSMVIAVLV